MTLKITHKLLLGFGIVIALSIGIGGYGLSRLAYFNELTTAVTDHDVRMLHQIRRVSVSEEKMLSLRGRALALRLLTAGGHADADAATVQERYQLQQRQTENLINDLKALAVEFQRDSISAERHQTFQNLGAAAAEALPVLARLSAEVQRQFALAGRGDFAAVAADLDKLDALDNAFDAVIVRAGSLTEELAQLGERASDEAYERAKISVLIVLFAIVVLGFLASYLIQRSITRPLGDFMRILERVGDGDLTQQALTDGSDELSVLGRSLNNMVSGLKALAHQTREVTGSLSSASAEILASTQQQAASTSEQATSVQETASTMDEISQSGKQISARAKEVATTAEASSSGSNAGLHAVEENARIMDGIREQAEAVAENIVALSEKMQSIGETISLVNDIAEKSNLLALNAAIEAAAAGEQGRRFSVVAGEIKNLADQSKDATKQVRTILEENQQGINTLVMLTEEAVKRVEAGKKQSEVAEHTIRQLADSTEESVTAFQQILAATNQQQIGIEQVSEALDNIRQATEQTASGTGQLEKAAQNLNELSQQLQSTVQRYRM